MEVLLYYASFKPQPLFTPQNPHLAAKRYL